MKEETFRFKMDEFEDDIYCDFRYQNSEGCRMIIDSIRSGGKDIEYEIEELGYDIKDIIWEMLSNKCN